MLLRLLILIWFYGIAYASDPVLFFTDITSGPRTGGKDNLGAFISIYGEGFGAQRGRSIVTIGGKKVARYVTWGENNGVARDLDMIVVQPGRNVRTGNIVVKVNGKRSNPLPFTVRTGKIYFVIKDAPNASDTNRGTYAEPFETPYRRSGEMKAGDIVYIKGGTFDTLDPRYPGWDCAICFFLDNDPNGTANSPVAWIGYPGDPPVIGAPSPMRRSLFVDDTIQHYVFANIEFTHYGAPLELRGDFHRIIGNYAHDGIYSNSGTIGISGNSAHYKIYGNYLHNNGEPGDKLNGSGFYLQGFGTNDDIDFGWNHIQHQRGARAIQVYGHLNGDFVDHIQIHDNLLSDSELNNIVLGGSDSNTNILGTVNVYNNIIIGGGDPGLRINDPNGTVIIQNNVLYNNGTPGANGSNAQLYVERAGVGKITFRDNIVYAVAPQTYVLIEAPAGSAVLNTNNNLYFNAGQCPDFELNCINANPLFVNPSNLDFHLQSQSPAINTGANTGIIRDFAGLSRPQEGAYDIGAFEWKPRQ
ncbi:MAG TPA: choice-of-anchor Q domain-containing protein [Acidobacteriota bacterium]|nr:choice-of-anchor Q domain-containing protein [Acidobacteriota bacterium]